MKGHIWTILGIAALVGLAIVAIAGAVALAETLGWDESADFADGEFDATVWNAADGGVTLSGRDSLWKYRSNPILSKGASTTWDDEGVFEPTTVFAKGKYYLFYTGYSGADYAIGMATSSDGKSFSKYASNPVLSKNPTAGTPDVTEVRDPFVIFENGTFKMWYTGVNSGTPSICYATSTSGTSWTRYASNPVLTKPSSGWGSTSFGDPCVVKVDNRYFMYLSGASVANEEQVGLATSKTGLSWTLHGSNPIIPKASSGEFGQKEIRDVAVFRDGPVWRLYFAGRNSAGDKYQIGSAWSYDGIGWVRNPLVVLDWSAAGFDSAQVQSPCVLWANDGLYLYFIGDSGGTPNYQLGLAQLKPWFIKKAGNPQLGTGSSYDANELTDPCVVFNEANGAYYMFYGSYGGGSYPYSISQASSTDGVSWSSGNKYSLNPVLSKSGTGGDWDDERVQDPCVIFENGTYKMWFSGYDGTKWQIGYATSTATGGAGTWTKSVSNPVLKVGSTNAWDESNVKMPWVIKIGTSYHMWYVGSSTSGGTHIGHATSSNGLSWTRDSANPVLMTAPLVDWEKSRVEQPCVLHKNGVYTMFYTGVKNSNYEVAKATSADGSAWTRDPSGSICPRGNDTDWDDNGTSVGCVRADGSFYHMYFSGYDGASTWQIGYAKWNSLGTATYTTPLLDAGASWPVQWGSLQWTARTPIGTSVRFQVATNRGGSIWSFVGPDGTTASYFEDSGRTFFEYQSGSRIRVRAFLSTDDEKLYLPLLRSLTVSYQRRSFGSPEVTVTSPNGGEDWMKTKTYPVTWVAVGNLNSTSVNLEYSTDNGTTWSSIADRQPKTGLYKWTVANTETSGALVKVTVTDIDGDVATDTSDATFAIDPPAPKSGAFLSPAEGAVLVPGTHEVRWTIDDPWGLAERPLTLELTTDGGATWELLSDGMALSDSWAWEVQPLARSSTACALRLSVLDWLGGISVVESGSFTIDMNVPTVTLSALGGRPIMGEPLTVTADAVDDVAVRWAVLHVSATDGSGERTYQMSSMEGGWTCTFAPERGDARMWATASDGTHESTSAVVPIKLAAASTTPEGAQIPTGLLGAALLGLAAAIGVTAVLWRRRSG
jgi:predicted GH43/DUF377 family glycosyl hydrolase